MVSVNVSNEENLLSACNIIKKGGIVAVPTETVYGLAGDATNDHAVARIFEAKGRPDFNPLIVHFADMDSMHTYVDLPPLALELGQAYWPGPLTMIVAQKENSPVSRLAAAGLKTLGVRVPDNDFTRNLIKSVGKPLAAPSANRSGHLSPTSAVHVANSLGDRVDMIIADSKSKIGLESTIIDLTSEPPALLRHGYITFEALQKTLPSLIDGTQTLESDKSTQPKSPGLLLKHYSPEKKLFINIDRPSPDQAFLNFGAAGFSPKNHTQPVLNLSEQGDLTEAAANLFAMLHIVDESDAQSIAVAPIPEYGLGVAINDRLRRAAHG